MKRILVAGAMLLALGCNGVLFQDSGNEHRKTAEEWFNDRWVGQSEDDVLVQYGKPDDLVPLSTGNHVVSYHREVAFATSRSAVTQYYGGARSDSGTIYCDRRFEIDK